MIACRAARRLVDGDNNKKQHKQAYETVYSTIAQTNRETVIVS